MDADELRNCWYQCDRVNLVLSLSSSRPREREWDVNRRDPGNEVVMEVAYSLVA